MLNLHVWKQFVFPLSIFANSSVKMTSSSAVAKGPRDASCLSVVSFVSSIVQYLERCFYRASAYWHSILI